MRPTILAVASLALVCSSLQGQEAKAEGPETLLAGSAGTAPNQLDCIWVLERSSGKDGKPTRHLALYQIVRNGDGLTLKLADARQIDWDLRIPQLSKAAPTVPEVKKAVEEAEKKEETGARKPK
jgi:hypothetical protein